MSTDVDYLCRYCGEPIEVRESGEWGHIYLSSGGEAPARLRFWCFGHRVAP
jgi:hypothetical protein